MRASRSLAIAVVLGLAAVAGSRIVFAQATAPPGDPKLGYQLYVRYGCYECHGYQGQGSGRRGSGGWGPMLVPKPLPFNAFLVVLRKPRADMPVYSTAILSDRDAADIYAYLASIPASKDAKDIPLLRGYLQQQ